MALVYQIENFLSKQRCQQLIELSEGIGWQEARVGKGMKLSSLRNNDRLFYSDPQLADEFYSAWQQGQWPGSKGSMAFNECFRFYRYGKQQLFDWHCDGSFKRPGQESRLTFLIYLNDNYKGGATEFQKQAVQPQAGKALIFDHQLRHRGAPIRKGMKYVLRTDVMFKVSQHR